MKRLEGKVALITGGGTGLGADFAKRFVEEGAKIVITGRRKEKLEEVANQLPKGSVEICSGDISNFDDAKAMVDATLKFGGKIDVLVNNAGIDPAATVLDISVEQWKKVIDINLTGTFFMIKNALPHMIEQGGGSIINIASLAAVRCIPAMVAYTSSKAGMIGLTKAVAYDYGKNNIRCNAVCPGGVKTEMLAHSMGGLAKALNADVETAFKVLTRFSPIPRVADPSEVSGIVALLASDEGSFITGSIIMVDGGAHIVDPCGASVASAGTDWGA